MSYDLPLLIAFVVMIDTPPELADPFAVRPHHLLEMLEELRDNDAFLLHSIRMASDCDVETLIDAQRWYPSNADVIEF